MITIPVSDVARAKKPLPVLDRREVLSSLLKSPVEQLWDSEQPLVLCSDAHPLAEAAHKAFYDHRPLVLTPDAVWFCLAQGFSQHIALNAEALRHRFVRHEGKAKLVVSRDDFQLGRRNPWPEAFSAFSEQIAGHVGKLRDLVVADFSTTGPIERAASELVLMEAFSPYFEYELHMGCGIPSVTLLGTPEDWRSVRQRAAVLSEFDLEHWITPLLPALDQIVASAEGRIDQSFWRSFFRYESGSGGAELTGWILLLFPYLSHVESIPTETGWLSEKTLVPNAFLGDWHERYQTATNRKASGEWLGWNNRQGPTLAQVPSGLASAPVLCTDVRTREKTRLRFVGGLFGVTQDEATGALKPEFGWAIVHDGPSSVTSAPSSPGSCD